MSETTWARSDFHICINLKTVLSLFIISELATVSSVTMCHFVNNVLSLMYCHFVNNVLIKKVKYCHCFFS